MWDIFSAFNTRYIYKHKLHPLFFIKAMDDLNTLKIYINNSGVKEPRRGQMLSKIEDIHAQMKKALEKN